MYALCPPRHIDQSTRGRFADFVYNEGEGLTRTRPSSLPFEMPPLHATFPPSPFPSAARGLILCVSAHVAVCAAVTTDYNAGFQGAVAGLKALSLRGQLGDQ